MGSYFWIRVPNDLPDNRVAAIHMVRSTECRLSHNLDKVRIYNKQIKNVIQKDVAWQLPAQKYHPTMIPYFTLVIIKFSNQTPFPHSAEKCSVLWPTSSGMFKTIIEQGKLIF